MITGELKSKIDQLWEKFWTGGITNPLTVIEQISFLFFLRLLDLQEQKRERKAKRIKGVKLAYGSEEQSLRWSQFKHLSGDEMLPFVRDKVFPHMKRLGAENSTFGRYMRDAQFMIQSPTLLQTAVSIVDGLPLMDGDSKGDLYEYVLSKLTTAGINGQFRTPRHIIRMMVELTDPRHDDIIVDPSCGTAGFLVAARQFLTEKYTSTNEHATPGDLLEKHKAHVENEMFFGFDFDATMLRIASMNLMLHEIASPNIYYQDSLNKSFEEGEYEAYLDEAFTVILANPPFKGSLDYESVQPKLIKKVKTKKTELLFLVLMLRMLKKGGRCAVVVPDGVLFGSSKAHKGLRKMLVEDHQLDAVISLPSGVFKPYAGVSTAILYFTKAGRTDNVWFYDLKADGYSLDDKRDKIDQNDIPDCLEKWRNRDPKKDTDRKAKAFFVPKKEIKEDGYDLSINRYKEIEYEEIEYDPPKKIIKQLLALEEECIRELKELEEMLG